MRPIADFPLVMQVEKYRGRFAPCFPRGKVWSFFQLVWNSKASQGNPKHQTINMTTSLCVTDLLNILLVDIPVLPAEDGVADAAAAVPKKGAAIVLPPAGQQLSALASAELSACTDVHDQFKLIKRSYFHLIRQVHPDKGGDAPTFRRVQDAFAHVRSMYDASGTSSIASFTDPAVLAQTVSFAGDVSDDEAAAAGTTGDKANVQPWEYYETAVTTDEPTYRVELAKSNNSQCTQTSATYRRCTQIWKTKTDKKTGEDKETLVNPKIAKGELRIGVYEDKTSNYSRWVHLECWRVPSKIWLGLPDGHLGHFKAEEKKKAAAAKASASASNEDSSSDDEDDDAIINSTKFKQYAKALDEMNCVVLAGFSDLPKKDRNEFVLHVMDRQNWAQKYAPRKTKAKKGADDKEEDFKKQPSGVAVPSLDGFINDFDMDEDDKKPAAAAAAAASTTGGVDMLVAVAKSVGVGEAGATAALVLTKEKFVAPQPGVGKGIAGALDGLRFVLTGTFPEIGGGSGLGLGKKKTEALIESFGGKVTGSISGKTDYLLVGKEPGLSKVNKANQNGITRLNLDDLKNLCEGGSADDIKPIQITSFSKGFGNNGLAIEASAAELIAAAAATQRTQPMITNGEDEAGAKKPAAKKPAAKKSQGKAEAKKPAAKKGGKTKKELKTEAKAAATKQAAEDKAERKAKLVRANKLRSTPIEELDWQSYLEAGDLDNENVEFLKKILKHESLKVSGKKAELLARLREHAGLEDPMDEDEDEEEAEESDDEEAEEMEVDYDDVKPSASSSSSEEEAINENYGYDMHYYDSDELKEGGTRLRSQFSAEIADEEAVV